MLARLLRQGGTYSLVGVVGKLSGFVLLAFYGDPEVLPKEDFGYLGQLDAVKMVALLFASAGLPLGILQFASSSALTEAERRAVPATALVLASGAGAAVVALGWAFAAPLADVLLGDPGRAEAVGWLAVYVGFKTVSDVSFTVLRQREKAGAYVLLGAVEMALLVAAVLVFLVGFGQGLVGVMRGYALAAGVVAAAVTPVLLRRVGREVRWGLVGPMLAFGLPLIASGLAGRLLNIGDRFLIVHYLGPEANAVYEWAARFGGVVNTFLVQSLGLAFTVLGLKALGATGSPDLHRRTFRHFSALAGWAVLGLGLFVGDVSRLLTDDPEYIGAGDLVVLVGGGFGFYGLYYVLVNVLYAAGRTRSVALMMGGAALFNLGLNVALIPRLGAAGAAWATLAAYAALALGTAALAQRENRAEYAWGALATVCALVAGLWLLARPTEAWSLGPRLGARVGVAAAYPPALFLLGVYRVGEVRQGLAAVRRRREHGGSTGRTASGAGGGRVDTPPRGGVD